MKHIIIILLFALTLSAQIKFGERDAIEKGHIDFTTHYIWFVLTGQIEIDGHAFDNSKTDCPIIFQANLDGVTIIDTCTGIQYTRRTCNKKGCKVIHLEKKEEPQIKNNDWFIYPNLYPIDNISYTDSAYINGKKKEIGKYEYYIYETDGSDVEIYKETR